MFEISSGGGGISSSLGDAKSAVGDTSSSAVLTTGDKYFSIKRNPNARMSDEFLLGSIVATLALYVLYKKL